MLPAYSSLFTQHSNRPKSDQRKCISSILTSSYLFLTVISILVRRSLTRPRYRRCHPYLCPPPRRRPTPKQALFLASSFPRTLAVGLACTRWMAGRPRFGGSGPYLNQRPLPHLLLPLPSLAASAAPSRTQALVTLSSPSLLLPCQDASTGGGAAGRRWARMRRSAVAAPWAGQGALAQHRPSG